MKELLYSTADLPHITYEFQSIYIQVKSAAVIIQSVSNLTALQHNVMYSSYHERNNKAAYNQSVDVIAKWTLISSPIEKRGELFSTQALNIIVILLKVSAMACINWYTREEYNTMWAFQKEIICTLSSTSMHEDAKHQRLYQKQRLQFESSNVLNRVQLAH